MTIILCMQGGEGPRLIHVKKMFPVLFRSIPFRSGFNELNGTVSYGVCDQPPANDPAFTAMPVHTF